MKMVFRTYIAICLLLIAVSTIVLFVVKHEVQQLHTQLHNLEKKIEQKKESIHILKAELAYLSKPQTIKSLAEKHLLLQLISPSQIISLKQ